MVRIFFVLGTHGLKSRLSTEMLSVFEVGVRYKMYHAFALIATAWVQSKCTRYSRRVVLCQWHDSLFRRPLPSEPEWGEVDRCGHATGRFGFLGGMGLHSMGRVDS